LAVHGNAQDLADVVRAHLDAGADQVCVQVLDQDPLPGFRAVAEVLLS
jgi:hypothetical protein